MEILGRWAKIFGRHFSTSIRDASGSQYIYRPLQQSHLRLLKLNRNEQGSLRFNLEHFRLDLKSPIKFSALSYVWGNTSQKTHLDCDGKKLEITEGLHDALKHVANFSDETLLWVDQICINQNDLAERAEQVKLMNTIYSKADLVLVWLGLERSSTKKAVDMISRVSKKALLLMMNKFEMEEYSSFQQVLDARENKHDTPPQLETHESLSVEDSKRIGLSFEEDENWAAFVEFFDRPWFERIWVVQEILPVRNAIMLCGSYAVSWDALQAAARWYYYKGGLMHKKHHMKVDGVTSTVSIELDWCGFSWSISPSDPLHYDTRPDYIWSLRLLLDAFTARLATEPKDKLFALIGLSEARNWPKDTLDSIVDYTRDVKTISTSAARAMVEHGDVREDNLDIFLSARRGSKEPEWPSWVPDWRLESGYGCRWDVGHPLPSILDDARHHIHGSPQTFDTGCI